METQKNNVPTETVTENADLFTYFSMYLKLQRQLQTGQQFKQISVFTYIYSFFIYMN